MTVADTLREMQWPSADTKLALNAEQADALIALCDALHEQDPLDKPGWHVTYAAFEASLREPNDD